MTKSEDNLLIEIDDDFLPALENMIRRLVIAREQFESSSASDDEYASGPHMQREAVVAQLDAILDFLRPELPPGTLRPLVELIGALANAESGKSHYLTTPRKRQKTGRAPNISKDLVMAHAAACVHLWMRAGLSENAAASKVARLWGNQKVTKNSIINFRGEVTGERKSPNAKKIYESIVDGRQDLSFADRAQFYSDQLKGKNLG